MSSALEVNDVSHTGSAMRYRTSSMDYSGYNPSSKRGRSGSISGRLRAASDLEEIGWIDKNQKGIIKDLIISGDLTLRNALDKYEHGDAHDLEALIQAGMLAPKQSLDLLDGLDMDFLKVGYSGDIGQVRSFSLGEDYFLDHTFDGDESVDRTRLDSISEHDLDNIFRHRNHSTSSGGALTDGDGSFDLVGGNFFDGLGGYFALPSSSRRHSLCLSPGLTTPRSGFISGMGTSGDVDLSAYESMAASLQAQSLALAQRQRNAAGRISTNASTKVSKQSLQAPSSSSTSCTPTPSLAKKIVTKTVSPVPESMPSNLPSQRASNKAGGHISIKGGGAGENSKSRNGHTTSALPTPQMQNRMGVGAHHAISQGYGHTPHLNHGSSSESAPVPPTETHAHHKQQHLNSENDSYPPHQRQQQLSEMQQSLMLRQLQMNVGRQQPQAIMSHPHGIIHASNSHSHYANNFSPSSGYYQQQPPPNHHAQSGQIFRAGSTQSKSLSTSLQNIFPIPEEESSLGVLSRPVYGSNSNSGTQSRISQFEADVNKYSSSRGDMLNALSLYNPGEIPPTAPKTSGSRGYVGAYSPEARRARIERFLAKRHKRVWTKKVKYDVRKNFADSRLRVKGRFVKKEDEELMKELLSI